MLTEACSEDTESLLRLKQQGLHIFLNTDLDKRLLNIFSDSHWRFCLSPQECKTSSPVTSAARASIAFFPAMESLFHILINSNYLTLLRGYFYSMCL